MFFKVIYYLIGLAIVGYKAYRLSQPELTKDFWDLWRWHDKAKKDGTKPTTTQEWKDKLGEDMFTSVITMALFAVAEFSWLILGLFSYNWVLILAFLIYGFVYNKAMKKRMETYRSVFVSSTNMNLFLAICVILFALINSFHLHIDLFKLIFGG